MANNSDCSPPPPCPRTLTCAASTSSIRRSSFQAHSPSRTLFSTDQVKSSEPISFDWVLNRNGAATANPCDASISAVELR